MKREKGDASVFDPRVGLGLLVLANVIAFSEKAFWLECCWIALLCLLMLGHRRWAMAVKWLGVFVLILWLQYEVLPVAPKWVATSFSIFANYARRMLPCLMVGILMLRCTPLRHFILSLRKLHLPQKLIIAISVTLRYFPAIREEVGYIRDAMKLRRIRGMEKVECLVVPLMVSATNTAEELSAAAVTRGIEHPARKTSVVTLQASALDLAGLAAGILCTVAVFVMG